MTGPTMDAIRAEGTFDLIIQGLGVGIVTPDHYLNSFYLPDSVINSHNWEYEGPEDLPALIREQSRTIDQVQRRAIVAQIEDILLTKEHLHGDAGVEDDLPPFQCRKGGGPDAHPERIPGDQGRAALAY